MEEKKKGTFKGHLRKMITALYLWTSQVKPTRFVEALKNDLCFSYDELNFNLIYAKPNEQSYKLEFDFGDLKIDYTLIFSLSEQTKRWVLSEIK